MSSSTGFRILAAVPGATLLGAFVYASRFDGWGAWATAPLFLVPVALSLAATSLGIIRAAAERAQGSVGRATVGFTSLAAIPLLWFLWRLMVTA